jgi:hypothetical protein
LESQEKLIEEKINYKVAESDKINKELSLEILNLQK